MKQIEKMINDYVSSIRSDRKKDLAKFYSMPHTAPQKIKASPAALSCVSMILACALLLSTALSPRDISVNKLYAEGVIVNYDPDADMTIASAPSPQEIRKILKISGRCLLPAIKFNDLTVYRYAYRGRSAGASCFITPRSNKIVSIESYYFYDKYNVSELSAYKDLAGKTTFNDVEISYSSLNDDNGESVWRLHFESGNIYNCTEVVVRGDAEISDIISEIFG